MTTYYDLLDSVIYLLLLVVYLYLPTEFGVYNVYLYL